MAGSPIRRWSGPTFFNVWPYARTIPRKIKLGTNVTNPSSRIAPVTACNFATLNVLAPGRVIMGIGTGNTSRRTLGMPAAKIG